VNPPTTVNSGVTTDSFFVLPDYWIVIDPGSGATATVEYTTGTANDIAGSHATWVAQGTYTTRTALKVEEDLQGLHFRIVASGGSIDYSVNGELSEADRLTLRSYTKAVVNQLGVGSTSLSSAYQISKDDDGKVFNCTTALTITIPASLSPRPSFIVNPPASGNVSIAVSGGANINGATTTLTRARSANVAGFAVVPYAESDGYGVSGS
jgi:hypothetical protein